MKNEMTDLTFSQILEQEIQEWKKFRRALRKEHQQVFDQLFEKTRLYAEAGGLRLKTVAIWNDSDLYAPGTRKVHGGVKIKNKELWREGRIEGTFESFGLGVLLETWSYFSYSSSFLKATIYDVEPFENCYKIEFLV